MLGAAFRGVRNAFRSKLRTLSVVLIIGLTIALALVMVLSVMFRVSTETLPGVRSPAGCMSKTAPLLSVMLANARMLPLNTVPVPSVALLPICQYTLFASAPLVRVTEALLAVVSVLPIWKMKTEFAFPLPFRVTVPVMPTEDALQ